MARYPSGSPRLDDELGGGAPAGQIHIWGESGSGVTSLGLSFVREAISNLYVPAMVVYNKGLPDQDFLANAGHPDLLVSVPYSGEAALDSAYQAIRHGVRVVYIDDISAIIPRINELGIAGVPNAQRRLLLSGLRSLRMFAVARGALVVLGNELREDLDRPGKKRPFMDDVVDQLSWVNIGMRQHTKRAPFGTVEKITVTADVKDAEVVLHLRPDGGLNRQIELLEALKARRMVSRRGAYWIGSNMKLGPGIETATQQLAEMDDWVQALLKRGRPNEKKRQRS